MDFAAITLWFLLEKVILIAAIIGLSFFVAMYTTLAERKVAGWMQDRMGPNRAGPFGILQPLADGGKLFFKEEIIPVTSNRILFLLGPALAMIVALVTSTVIPWGAPVVTTSGTIALQVTDVDMGILIVFSVVSVGVYGIMIGGWASNNKFSLLAAIRGASQMVSYELPMSLALIAILFMTGSLKMSEIVLYQINHGWNVVYQPLGFLLFFICALAECNRTPFDLPEAENELNFGYHQEYSSMKLGFYLFAEYINMFVSSAVMATLFLGGYDIPFVNEAAWGLSPWVYSLLSFGVLMAKVSFLLFVFIWIRWTIPRFRYDQLMNLGWKKMIPLALFNMLLSAAILLWLKS
ncbi:MAG: NADH-quinone oxidoreductase subunit NuoH [Bacteroidota bacterium]|jgi:NADH-quinone oxidoreductase subunit H